MKSIIFALLFVAGAYAGISTVDRDNNQLELRQTKSYGMRTLGKVLDLKNLVPVIFDAAKNISTQLKIGGMEALHIVIDTISALMGVVPIVVKRIPEFAKNLPAIMKTIPPMIDSLKILIEASPELMKALPPFIENLPILTEKLIPAFQATPDLLTSVPAVIEILPDLSNILQKLTPVLNSLNKGVAKGKN